MVLSYVHDAAHQERAEKIDVLGFVLLATCVGTLQYMLEKGERYDWFDSKLIVGLGVTSVLAFILLIWRELTVDEPIINFRVLKSRQLAAGVSIAAGLGLALFGSIFVLPIFLQNLHGLTANQTGLVILPGAIASAVTMAFVGKNANKLDARATVAIGAILFFVAMWMLARMTLVSGPTETFWPLILRGVGLGLIFVPLTSASMADIKVSELAQGTGMFNLTRQLGGSLGIAIMATLLTRFTTQKKALLTEHITAMDPTSLGRLEGIVRGLIGRGSPPLVAKQQALLILDRQVQAQASVLAFSRIYILSGIILLATLPLLFVFRTGKGRGSMGPAH
jgi:MFS transporter, DHA2 family, multidrug resistance protein